MKIAIAKPVPRPPASMPMMPPIPNTTPTMTAIMDGTAIFLSAPSVEISTQRA